MPPSQPKYGFFLQTAMPQVLAGRSLDRPAALWALCGSEKSETVVVVIVPPGLSLVYSLVEVSTAGQSVMLAGSRKGGGCK